MSGGEGQSAGSDGAGAGADGGVARNIVAIFHASFHPTKGNTIDWSLTSPSPPSSSSSFSSAQPTSSSIDLTGVEFSVLPSGLHLVERDVVYFTHGPHAGLAVFRRRPTRSKQHRGFRLASLGILLEESPRSRPWLYLESLRKLADEVYRDADRRERELERGEIGGSEGSTADLLGLGAPGDLTEKDLDPARRWFEERSVRRSENTKDGKGRTGVGSVDAWAGWSEELDGAFASQSTPTHHLPHLLRILGLSSLTLYKFVLSRRRILIYTLPPVEVAGVLAWIAADLCREHHMAPRRPRSQSQIYGVPMPSLFSDSSTKPDIIQTAEDVKNDEERLEDVSFESPTVLGMITLSDIPRLEAESAKGKGWIACTTDAIFMEKPQYYDLIVDLTTSTPSRASRPSMYMSKKVSNNVGGGGVAGGRGGKKKEKWKLESVRFTWSDVKLWAELDRILKLDSTNTSLHSHNHPHAPVADCCSPKSPSSATPGTGSGQNIWADAFKVYEDVCLLCATLWMGLGTWRSNSRQSFASREIEADNQGRRRTAGEWGAAREPGDQDWSMEGTHMRALGMGIEGNPALRRKDKDKDRDKGKESRETKIRAVGLGIEGRPSQKGRSKSSTYGYEHPRKASASSTLTTQSVKVPRMASRAYVETVSEESNENEHAQWGEGELVSLEECEEEMRRQNVQTTLALLQTFHANTVFWLSKLREMIPPPSLAPTPTSLSFSGVGAPGSKAYSRLRSTDQPESERDEEEEEEEEEEESEEEEILTITGRDLLSLELGVMSDLDARFVEWLVEAEGYAYATSSSYISRTATSTSVAKKGGRRRRVVVKRGWQELLGIWFGLK